MLLIDLLPCSLAVPLRGVIPAVVGRAQLHAGGFVGDVWKSARASRRPNGSSPTVRIVDCICTSRRVLASSSQSGRTADRRRRIRVTRRRQQKRDALIETSCFAVKVSVRVSVEPSMRQAIETVNPGSIRFPVLPPTRANRRHVTWSDRPSAPGVISSAPSLVASTRPSGSSKYDAPAGTVCSTGAVNPGSPCGAGRYSAMPNGAIKPMFKRMDEIGT